MGRIITLSMAVFMIVGGTGVVLSETVEPDSRQVAETRGVPNPDGPAWSQLDPGLHYVGPAAERGERVFVPRGYARSIGGGIPNPDAPSWRQLDPGLHYVGP
jgi:hypothetical protein